MFPSEAFLFVFPWRLRRLLPLARALRAARADACVAGRGALPRRRPCPGSLRSLRDRSAQRLGDVPLAGTRRVPLPVPSPFPVSLARPAGCSLVLHADTRLRRRMGARWPAVSCLLAVSLVQGFALEKLAVRSAVR